MDLLVKRMDEGEKELVATLALGSRPRLEFARVWAKREARESHLMFSGV
jgi:hypothetical protein